LEDKNRTIALIGEINETLVLETIKDMEDMLREDSKAPIKVMVNSGGGHFNDGMALFDCFTLAEAPIHTYAIGTVYSSAFCAYIGGCERYALPNSVFLLHPPRWSNEVDSTPTTMFDVASFARRQFEHSTRIMAERLGIPEDEFTTIALAESFFVADDAKEIGIVHNILTSFPFWQAITDPVENDSEAD